MSDIHLKLINYLRIWCIRISVEMNLLQFGQFTRTQRIELLYEVLRLSLNLEEEFKTTKGGLVSAAAATCMYV